MSLLLDALNKADQERKRNETPGISSNHEQRGDEDEPRGYPLGLIAAGVVGLVLLLALIYWLGQRSTAPTPAPNTASVTETNAKKSIAPVEAKPAETNEQQQTTFATNPAPEAEENVADLYQQNSQAQPDNASITISTPPPAPEQPMPEPAPQAPALDPAPTIDPENVPPSTSIAQFANLPELHDLPNNVLEKVPTLNYSEHNYNVNGNSSVKINGAILHADEQIANGIVIDEILEDGMTLHIDNHSFKMRAMNSWVNM